VGQPVVYVTQKQKESDFTGCHSVNVGIAPGLDDFSKKAMLADTILQGFFVLSPLRRLLRSQQHARRVPDEPGLQFALRQCPDLLKVTGFLLQGSEPRRGESQCSD
jgi:hypothetical protein